jgi:predicted PurR-regulated permease PerM
MDRTGHIRAGRRTTRRHQGASVPATSRSDKSPVPADDDARGQGAVDRAQGAVDDEQQAVDQAQGAVDDDQQAVDRMQEAVDEAAAIAEETGGLGRPGRPLNKRSPFFVGMSAAAGVAVTYGLVELVIRARAVLVLIGLAMFIAAGLEPAVSWLTRHRFPRWAAVTTILLIAVGIFAGFLAAAIPPLTTQATALANELPHYLHTLQDHNSSLGRLNTRFHIQQRLSKLLSTKSTALVGGVLGAGALVLSAATSVLAVAVLVVYFLAAMPRIRLFVYRFAPQSRRARVILIGDEIFTKVGGFVLGNFLTSVIAGLGTYIWLLIFGIPYAILLALLVALLDLIPVVGSTAGGAIVSLVALTVSLPVAIATLGFYIAYRLAEDYLIVPRILGRTVQVPAVVTVVALLVGGALMGIVGALVAIPVAAALRLLLHEVAFHRLDSS